MLSRTDDGLVVYALFNKSTRKYRRRKQHRQRRKVDVEDISKEVKNIASGYKCLNFTYKLRTYLISLCKNRMKEVVRVIEHLVLDELIPARFL